MVARGARPLRAHVVADPGATINCELTEMLTQDLVEAGVAARATTEMTGAGGVDLVVLVGEGPEFGDLGLRSDGDAVPTVVLWEVDPLPPPGISQRAVSRRLHMTGIRERVVTSRLGPLVTRLPRSVKRASRRALAGPDVLGATGELSRKVGSEPIAFRRLRWIRDRVAEGRLHHILCTSMSAVDTLADAGITAGRMPIGYHAQMGRDEGRARDLDVVFLGQASPHSARRARLDELEERLGTHGLGLTHAAGVYGTERAAVLNRAKIVLNLRSNTWHPEILRFVFAGACGAMVVSEGPIADTDPFLPGRDFVVTSLAEAPDVIEHYVRSEVERKAVVDAATELLTNRLTMRAAADAVVALAE